MICIADQSLPSRSMNRPEIVLNPSYSERGKGIWCFAFPILSFEVVQELILLPHDTRAFIKIQKMWWCSIGRGELSH